MKIKFVSVLALCGIVCALLAACLPQKGQSKSEENTAELKSNDVVVLKYADWDKFDTAFIDEWNKNNPSIQVEFTSIPDNGEKMTKVDVLAMSGDLDIMPMSDAEQFIRMKNGVLAPLDEFIKKDNIDMKANFNEFEEWSKYNGTYYCFPVRSSLQVVYYNKDIFDAAGIEYPSNNWTWDEYIQTAKTLTKGEGKDKVYGAYTHTFGGDWATIATQGASWYTAKGECNIQDPVFKRALEVRKEMDEKGYHMPFSQITAVKTMPNSEFLGGKAAMATAGSWLVRDMKNKEKFPFDFNVGIAYIPRVDDTYPGDRLSMSCSALGIPSNSKHKEEAWKFLRYYIEESSDYIAKSGNIPCYQPAWNDGVVNDFIENSGLSLEQGKMFFNKNATITTNKIIGAAAPMYNQIVNEETPLYFNGEKSLSEILTSIETKTNAAIQEDK